MNLLITGHSSPLSCAIRTYFQFKNHTVFTPNRFELSVQSENSISQFLENKSIELLVYIAATNINNLILRTSIKDWQSQFEINFHGAYRTLKNWFNQCDDIPKKHAILVSSYSALHPHLGQAAYSTSKAAMIGLMQGLVSEIANRNEFRINTILPGLFYSGIMNQNFDLDVQNSLMYVGPFIEKLHFQMPHSNGNLYNLDNRNI